jgi:hypothetical protein
MPKRFASATFLRSDGLEWFFHAFVVRATIRVESFFGRIAGRATVVDLGTGHALISRTSATVVNGPVELDFLLAGTGPQRTAGIGTTLVTLDAAALAVSSELGRETAFTFPQVVGDFRLAASCVAAQSYAPCLNFLFVHLRLFIEIHADVESAHGKL